MPMLYSRWDRRDNADRTDFGLASLNMCRQQRGRDGVTSARYYWSDASTIVVLVESERRLLPLEPGNADLAKGGFAMNDLARRVDYSASSPTCDMLVARSVDALSAWAVLSPRCLLVSELSSSDDCTMRSSTAPA